MVALVGLLMAVAVLSTFAFYVLWTHNLTTDIGVTNPGDLKELPGPRGMGIPAPVGGGS